MSEKTNPLGEAPDATTIRRGLQAQMTAMLVLRQFSLLFVAATALFLMWFFLNYHGQVTGPELWEELPAIDLKVIALPMLIVLTYGYVLFNGILFAIGPSERSFNLFFYGMLTALLVLNYDQSILDWFVILGAKARLATPQVVRWEKILLAGPFFLAIITMHYNILADDFARRMLRRGVPTEEVAQIRPGIFKILVPTIITASLLALGLSLVGEFSALTFGRQGLFPKVELVILALLGALIAFLLRGILRDLSRTRPQE